MIREIGKNWEVSATVPARGTRAQTIEDSVDRLLDEYLAETDRRAGGHIKFDAETVQYFRELIRKQIAQQIPVKRKKIHLVKPSGEHVTAVMEEE